MSDLFPGWTTTGVAGTVATVLIAVWRRVRSSPSAPSLLTRLAQAVSAIGRLQIAEEDMAAMKRSLLQREEDNQYLRDRRAEDRAEIESLNAEINRLRSLVASVPSPPSSGGFTGKRGGRTRKKPTS